VSGGAAEGTRLDEIFAWLDEKPTLSRHVQAVRRLESLHAEEPALFTPTKMLFVRNFTIEPIEPLLRIAGYRAGLAIEPAYSSYEPEADESLGEFLGNDPAVVVLALRLEDSAPALMHEFLTLDPGTASELADAALDRTLSLGARIRASGPAPILVLNFVTPLSPDAGLADAQDPQGQLNITRSMNVELARRIGDVSGMHIFDIDHLFAGIGLGACFDERSERTAGAPFSQVALRALAGHLVRHVRALKGARIKCVIVDCDNTLWGGVVGEDGPAGLLMDANGAGRPYRELQRALLNLRRRGTILAICSKNEEKDVLDVLRNHPDSVLHEDDFAAMRINWDDKAENIEALATELNLALEHMLYIDDNPVECEWIAQRFPTLTVVQWSGGEDPLASIEGFDSLVLTDEDRARTELYRSDAKRKEASKSATSIDDYLRTLEMVATIGSARREFVARLAQLTQRTNQFNLTTRRYDAAAMQAMVDDPDATVLWLDLKDRFGANGIVGCAIARFVGEDTVIDSLMLSCRVIGRGAEAVLVNKVATMARARGAHKLIGEFISSERNAQVSDLYTRLGFAPAGEQDGARRWTWTLEDGTPPVPDWIAVVDRDEEGR